MKYLFILLLCCLPVLGDVTPYQWLTNQVPPTFAAGHHLPHLARWGYLVGTNAAVEFADKWGYGLEFGNADAATVATLGTPGSRAHDFAALATAQPSKYKLMVITWIPTPAYSDWPGPPPLGLWCTNSSGQLVDNAGHTWNDPSSLTYTKTVSTEAPDSYWQTLANTQVGYLSSVAAAGPLGVIMTDGEYGVDVWSPKHTTWLLDPRIVLATNSYPSADATWSAYVSASKAHQLAPLTAGIKSLSKEIYAYYETKGEQFRYCAPPGGTTTPHWTWPYGVGNTNFWFYQYCGSWFRNPWILTNSDCASFENYYSELASIGGWLSATNAGWPSDLLTKYLNGVGYMANFGQTTNYSWVSGGWNATTGWSDIDRYTGYLKCLYTGGMVGGIAGYFALPAGGLDATFNPATPPHWLLQMERLSRVHALFSHLERYTFNGSLLHGPDVHLMAGDQPAYEFPAGPGGAVDYTARVIGRKLNASDDWLLTAWAADGISKPANVTIPTLGAVTLTAASTGNVYRATVAHGVELVNNLGVVASDSAPSITVQPANRTVTSGGTATFTVTVTGTAPLSYQWYFESTPTGTDSATLTIAGTTSGNAGSYHVTVTNSAGSVDSSTVTLTVNTPTPPVTSGKSHVGRLRIKGYQ